MNLLEVRHTNGNEEIVELQTEEDFLQFVTQLCWDNFNWTPLLEIHEKMIFVHSETWEDDFYSEEGAKEWIHKGIDFNHESDLMFYMKLKKLLNIEVL